MQWELGKKPDPNFQVWGLGKLTGNKKQSLSTLSLLPPPPSTMSVNHGVASMGTDAIPTRPLILQTGATRVCLLFAVTLAHLHLN
jgi:hypothetical protein